MTERLIKVGRIAGVFGVKGWVKVFSYTEDKENILAYSPWLLDKAGASKTVNVIKGATHGKAIIALLEGVEDRDAAALLAGSDIFIDSGQLPSTDDGEYYWSELIGLEVVTTAGVQLGVVDGLLATGANDVLIVKGDRQRAIPFIQGQSVVEIDLLAGRMTVDWDPDF